MDLFSINTTHSQLIFNFSDIESENIDLNETVQTNETIGVLISKEQIFTLILPYSIIFLLAIIGNALVIITLGSNRRMRSVTNIFLLNLAVSDLLLGVFCMPFTLVGVLLKEFVFGRLMCSLISYLQGLYYFIWTHTLSYFIQIECTLEFRHTNTYKDYYIYKQIPVLSLKMLFKWSKLSVLKRDYFISFIWKIL